MHTTQYFAPLLLNNPNYKSINQLFLQPTTTLHHGTSSDHGDGSGDGDGSGSGNSTGSYFNKFFTYFMMPNTEIQYRVQLFKQNHFVGRGIVIGKHVILWIGMGLVMIDRLDLQ